MKKYTYLFLSGFLAVSFANAQPLKIVSSKEGSGNYFPKSLALPQTNGLVLLTGSLLYSIDNKTDATLLGENMELKGQKLPFQLWDTPNGYAQAKNVFVGNFSENKIIFAARKYTSKVDFGYSLFGNDILVPPTSTVLFTYKINGNSQDAFQFENDYLFGGNISEDKEKVGVVYFPDGNKGKTDDASTLNIACYDFLGKELWSKTGELPNESRFRVRIIDCKTDNRGNVFAILNYIRFSSPYYISKGQYAIAAGPDFENIDVQLINFNKTIITVDKKTWVDQKGGYYVLGAAKEDLGQERFKDWLYYTPLTGEKAEVTYLDPKASGMPVIPKMTPEMKNDFPNMAPTFMETNGVYVVDANHFLILTPTQAGDYTAFLMNNDGKILDHIYINYEGAAYMEEIKTPFIKKIGDKICIFYQGTIGKNSTYVSDSQLPEAIPIATYMSTKSSVFLDDITLTDIVGKYMVYENKKFSQEYTLEGTEGYGMPSHVFHMDGKEYFLFNKKNGKKDVSYKLLQME